MKATQQLFSFVLIGSMLALSVNVFAQPNSHHRGEGRGGGMFKHKMHGAGGGIERFAEELGLSDEQLKKLKTIKFDAKKKAVVKRSEVKLAHIELREFMQADNPDKGAIKKQVEKIGRLKTDMMLAKVDKKFAVKNILTDEQQAKMKKLRKERFSKSNRGDRKGRRHGFGFNDDEFEGYFLGGIDEDSRIEPYEEQEL